MAATLAEGAGDSVAIVIECIYFAPQEITCTLYLVLAGIWRDSPIDEVSFRVAS